MQKLLFLAALSRLQIYSFGTRLSQIPCILMAINLTLEIKIILYSLVLKLSNPSKTAFFSLVDTN